MIVIPSPVSNETNAKELFLPIIGELSKFITRPICFPNNEYWYQIEDLSDDELSSLIKFSGYAEINEEPKEVKKNFLREMGLQIIADVPAVMIGAALGSPLGPIGMFIGGSLGGLVGAFAGTAAERGIAGDKNPIYNSLTDTLEDAPLIVAAHGLGAGAVRSGKAITSLFKQGREPVRNVVIPSPVSNKTNEKELFLPITGELSKFITCSICLPNNEYWY